MVLNEQQDTPQRIAYSDESKHNTGRYRSLGLVSLRYTELKRIRNKISDIISGFDLSELKRKKVRDERHRTCVVEIINHLIPELHKQFARIDVLLWDTYDRRHTIIGRDDQHNLARMYLYLLKNVMHKRWAVIFSLN